MDGEEVEEHHEEEPSVLLEGLSVLLEELVDHEVEDWGLLEASEPLLELVEDQEDEVDAEDEEVRL